MTASSRRPRLAGHEQQVRAMVADGWLLAEIARHFAVEQGAVASYCRRHAIDVPYWHEPKGRVVDIHVFVTRDDARAILQWQAGHRSRSFSGAALEMIRAAAAREPRDGCPLAPKTDVPLDPAPARN
jgi:hypothetical protein